MRGEEGVRGEEYGGGGSERRGRRGGGRGESGRR